MSAFTCFKAYDIRGHLGAELNEDVAYTQFLDAKREVIGGDCACPASRSSRPRPTA